MTQLLFGLLDRNTEVVYFPKQRAHNSQKLTHDSDTLYLQTGEVYVSELIKVINA